jgi:DNA polymerase III delta prime subunit
MHGLQVDKGLSLADILTFLHELILQIKYPPPVMNFLLSEMSHIEYRMSHGANEKLQLASLVGVFRQGAELIAKYQKEREQKQIKL